MKKLTAIIFICALLLTSCIGYVDDIDPLPNPPEKQDDTTPEHPDDTTVPDDDTLNTSLIDIDTPKDDEVNEGTVLLQTDMFTVKDMGDGRFAFFSDYINKVFDDAFIVEYTDGNGKTVKQPILISKGKDICTLYSTNPDGYLRSYYNAEKFTQLGNYILGDKVLYGPDLVKVFTVTQPYYAKEWSLDSAEYIDTEGYGQGTIRFELDVEGELVVYTYYPTLGGVAEIPKGASLIAQQYTAKGGTKLYKSDGEYYCTYESMTVKLPLDGDYLAAHYLNSDRTRYIGLYDNTVTFTEFQWLFTTTTTPVYHVGYLKTEYTVSDTFASIYDYNGATVIDSETSVYILKDGKILREFDFGGRHGIDFIGDYLAIGEDLYMPYIVITPDLTELSINRFTQFMQLSDGNYIGTDEATRTTTVYAPDGTEIYTTPRTQETVKIGVATTLQNSDGTTKTLGGDYVLVKENGIYKLLTPYGEELCTFEGVEPHWSMHVLLGGYHSKDGYTTGIYFVFQDSTDGTSDGFHMYEYFYSFETGEHGLIDNGYADFAYAKPVLYLYPTEQTEVCVKFEHPERLIVDYPAYNDGWMVTASPDGTLTGANGREYYALYWEESSDSAYYAFPDGFCVKGADSATFLEEKLAALGFTDKEANEFIIYWLPILEANEYNLIRFELTEEREASNALHISPTPDSLLRMAMHIKALESPIEIREQWLPTFERNGFVAVEWGGCVH